MTSMFLKSALAAALAAGGLFSAAPATADSFADHFLGEPTEGRWMIRVRGIAVSPDETLDANGVAGEDADISTAYVPEIDFTYFFTDNLAVELIAATARHEVDGTGSLNGVDLGELYLLPPTLTAQYHITQIDPAFKPYFGAGINYTLFYNEDGGDVEQIDYDNAFGFALQAGIDIRVADGFYLNADVKKIFLETEWEIRDDALGNVKGDVEIDPWIFGVGAGYRF